MKKERTATDICDLVERFVANGFYAHNPHDFAVHTVPTASNSNRNDAEKTHKRNTCANRLPPTGTPQNHKPKVFRKAYFLVLARNFHEWVCGKGVPFATRAAFQLQNTVLRAKRNSAPCSKVEILKL